MIKIKFDNNTLHIPSQWSDIRLEAYEKWFDQKPETKHQYVQFVSNVCNIDTQYLLDAPATLFETIDNTIRFVFGADLPPSHTVLIDGTEYSINTSEQLTLGEWVDVESIIESNSDSKIADILATLCRPLAESYNAQQCEERKPLFRALTCDKALPLLSFFLSKKKESEAILLHYSKLLELADQVLKDTKIFATNGDGTKQLPIWQRIKYIYLMKSLRKKLSKYLDSSFTN